jgi:hypothetical protein
MSDYSLVLSDELLKNYVEFKQGKVNKPKILEHLLNYYHSIHITNTAQLKRINYEDPALLQQLAAQDLISQTLDELVNQTRYKLILNTENVDYPYVNIYNDQVEKNFSLTFRKGENRDKAIQLITALCVNAKSILIFDRYFCNRWNETQQLFKQIIPNKKLTLLHDGHLEGKQSEIKRICNKWIIKSDRRKTFTNFHDRYLLIDDKIEIMLSSGFDNLFSTDKDLTCLVRYR